MEKPVLTAKEACQYMQITKSTLYKLIRKKKIRCNKVGKDYRFLRSDLDNLVRGEPQ